MNDYYLLTDAARILNTMPHRITYILLTRKVPEPMRIGGRRIFTVADLTRIAEVLKLGKEWETQLTQGRAL